MCFKQVLKLLSLLTLQILPWYCCSCCWCMLNKAQLCQMQESWGKGIHRLRWNCQAPTHRDLHNWHSTFLQFQKFVISGDKKSSCSLSSGTTAYTSCCPFEDRHWWRSQASQWMSHRLWRTILNISSKNFKYGFLLILSMSVDREFVIGTVRVVFPS